MGIRTACWLAAIVFTLTGPHWVAWLFVIGSLFLPYVAVVMANAGTTPDPTRPQLYDAPRKQIGPPRDTGESERSERDSDPF